MDRGTGGPTLALVAVAALWGSTFVVVKEAIREVPPLAFLTLRFVLGVTAAAVWWRRSLREVGRRDLVGGLVAGLALAGGYALQTLGLRWTQATSAGFITGLFVVFTPLGAALVLRKPPGGRAAAGVALATAGLGLLTLREGLAGASLGDLLVLGCAAAFAGHFVALERYAPGTDFRRLTVLQLGVAALLLGLLSPAGGWRLPSTPGVWFAVGLTGLGATAGAFAVQTWAQTRLSATRTALVATTEPVFAGLFGYLLLGERLSPRQWAGAALILGGMLCASLPGGDRPTPR